MADSLLNLSSVTQGWVLLLVNVLRHLWCAQPQLGLLGISPLILAFWPSCQAGAHIPFLQKEKQTPWNSWLVQSYTPENDNAKI